MTLADNRTAVRGLLVDDAYDATLIDQASNWVVNQLFTDYRLRMAQSSDTISALINATTADFPVDLLTRIKGGLYVTSPAVYEMEDPLEYNTFMRNYANFATAKAAAARTWTEYGRAMRFAAPLKTATTFAIDYLRKPVLMENDNDDCELDDIYAELWATLTKARIMEINEDYGEAEQERTKAAPLVTTFVRNEGLGGGKTGPTVMRTNRHGRGRASGSSYRADRDF